MIENERIIQSVYLVMDEVNAQLPEGRQLAKFPETVLFGRDGVLDSLGLVNFVVATEQKVQEDFAVPVSLTDERAMSQKNSPFRTVSTLVDYLSVLLREAHHG